MELPAELCFLIASHAGPRERWALLAVNRRWRAAALDVSSRRARKFRRRYRDLMAEDDLLTLLCVPFPDRQAVLPELISEAFRAQAPRVMRYFEYQEPDHYKTRFWIARSGRMTRSDAGEPELNGWAAGRCIQHLPTARTILRSGEVRDYERVLHNAVKAKNWELIELLTPARVGGRVCPRLAALVDYDDEESRWLEMLLSAYGLATAAAHFRRIVARIHTAAVDYVDVPDMHPEDWLYLVRLMARLRCWHLVHPRPAPFRPSLLRYRPPRFFLLRIGWLSSDLWPMTRLAAIARGVDPEIYRYG